MTTIYSNGNVGNKKGGGFLSKLGKVGKAALKGAATVAGGTVGLVLSPALGVVSGVAGGISGKSDPLHLGEDFVWIFHNIPGPGTVAAGAHNAVEGTSQYVYMNRNDALGSVVGAAVGLILGPILGIPTYTVACAHMGGNLVTR